MALRDSPGKSYLGARLAVFLANLGQNRIVDQLAHVFASGVYWVLVAKWTVLREMDALGGMVGSKVLLLKVSGAMSTSSGQPMSCK